MQAIRMSLIVAIGTFVLRLGIPIPAAAQEQPAGGAGVGAISGGRGTRGVLSASTARP